MAPLPPKIFHKSTQIDTSIPKLDPARVVTLLMARFGASPSPPTKDDHELVRQFLNLLPKNMRKGIQTEDSEKQPNSGIVPQENALNGNTEFSEDISNIENSKKSVQKSNFSKNLEAKESNTLLNDIQDSPICDYPSASPFPDGSSSPSSSTSSLPNSPAPEHSQLLKTHKSLLLNTKDLDNISTRFLFKLDKAYRYWTKQSEDSKVPLVVRDISDAFGPNANRKSKKKNLNPIASVLKRFHGRPILDAKQLLYYHNMVQTRYAAPVLEKIDNYVLEKFQSYQDEFVCDQVVRDWAVEAWGKFDPKAKLLPWFEPSDVWLSMLRNKFGITLGVIPKDPVKPTGPQMTSTMRMLEEGKKVMGDLANSLEPDPQDSTSEPKVRASKRKRAPPPREVNPDLENLSLSESDGDDDEDDDLDDSDDLDFGPNGPIIPKEVPFVIQALRNIYQYAHERFQEVLAKGEIVIRDKLIQEWGREAKAKFDPDGKVKFTASRDWMMKFKRRYGIVLKDIYNRPRNPNSKYYKEKERKKAKKAKAEQEAQTAIASMENPLPAAEEPALDLNVDAHEQPVILGNQTIDYLQQCEVQIYDSSTLYLDQNALLPSNEVILGQENPNSGVELLQQQLAAAQQQATAYQTAYQQLLAQLMANQQSAVTYQNINLSSQSDSSGPAASNSLFYNQLH